MILRFSKHPVLAILISCLIVSFAEFAFTADEATKKNEELSNLKKDVEKIKEQKKGVIKKERSILTELKTIDKQLNVKQRELDIYRKNLARIENELRIVENNLIIAQNRLEENQRVLNTRLKVMYKLGYQDQRVSYLKLLIDSNNISDITSRYAYITSIAEADKNLLDETIKQKAEVERQKKIAEEKRQQIIQNKNNTEKLKDVIVDKKQAKNEILGSVRKDKAQLTKAQKEMEASIGRLERLIAELKRNQDQGGGSSSKNGYNTIPYSDSKGLAGQAGRLPWPASGSVIENQAPSMKGVTIRAEYGVEIKCVDDGIVDHARWFDGVGYGNMIIINHGNGYRTLYAHASKISVREGQIVSKGQKLGEVGDTGSINGTSLYFEIWKGTEALPTRRWLGSK